MPRFMVYGSSTTRGLFDLDKAGWSNRIQAHYLSPENGGPTIEVSNFARRGMTTSHILKLLPRSLELVKSHGATERFFGIFQLGGGDAWRPAGTREAWHISQPQFKRNLAGIGDFCLRHFTGLPVFVTMPPLSEKYLWDPKIPKLCDFRADDDNHYYNDSLREYAEEHQFPLVDLDLAFRDNQQKHPEACLYAPDMTHPNAEGHQIIASEVQLVLDGILKQNPHTF